MKQIIFITSNKHKVREANKIGKSFGVKFKQKFFKYPEIRADSVNDVAKEGAKYCYEKLRKALIVEDSGLFINALNKFPGTYSKFVLGKIGLDGILRLMQNKKDRTAFFVSSVGFADKNQIKTFNGVVKGKIAKKIRGSCGFGYDPVFIPNGFRKTYGEDDKIKNKTSHRFKSITKFCKWYHKYS